MEWTEFPKGEDPDYYIVTYQLTDAFNQKVNVINILKKQLQMYLSCTYVINSIFKDQYEMANKEKVQRNYTEICQSCSLSELLQSPFEASGT